MIKRYSQADINSLLLLTDPDIIKDTVQKEVLSSWRSSNKRGTFEGATGVGKSKVGVMATIAQFEKKPDSIVYIATPTATLRDTGWPDEFKKWNVEHLISKIVFLCHTSMHEVLVEGEVDLFIYDEIHHITVDNMKFFTNNKVWDILSLGATISDMDEVKLELLNKYCPVFFSIPVEDAISLKLVTEFEIIVLKCQLNSVDLIFKDGEKFITEMEYYKRLSKHIQNAMFIEKMKWSKFKWIQKRVELIMNLPTKKKIAQDVLKQIIKEELRTLIFCGSIDQCNELCGENVYHSKSGGKKFLNMFIKKQINTLGAVKALNEGENLPDVDQSFIIQLSSKSKDLIQRIGRNIRWRPNHIGKIIILVAKGTADEKWYLNAVKDIDPKRIKEYNIKPAI